MHSSQCADERVVGFFARRDDLPPCSVFDTPDVLIEKLERVATEAAQFYRDRVAHIARTSEMPVQRDDPRIKQLFDPVGRHCAESMGEGFLPRELCKDNARLGQARDRLDRALMLARPENINANPSTVEIGHAMLAAFEIMPFEQLNAARGALPWFPRLLAANRAVVKMLDDAFAASRVICVRCKTRGAHLQCPRCSVFCCSEDCRDLHKC